MDTLIQNVLNLNNMIVMRKRPQGISKNGKMGNKKKYYEKKKIIYTMEYSEDEDTSGDEETKILFMGVDTQAQNGESDKEGEVGLKFELISALEELKKHRKKNKQSNQIISDLKTQLQEAKKIEEGLYLQLKKIIQESERLEEEIM